MSKFVAIALALAGVSSQACTIQNPLKFCIEVAKYKDTTQQILLDGQPSTDFKLDIVHGSYLKISYLKPITKSQSGILVIKTADGKEQRRPLIITTDVINDGSSIPQGMISLISTLKAQ